MKKIILILVLSLFTANVYADSHVKRILSTSQTGMGNDIVYPTGKAKITAFEFTVPVGAPVTPHTHSFPVLIMIQQGEIELIHEGKPKYSKLVMTFVEDVELYTSRKILEMFQLKRLQLQLELKVKKL